MRKKYLTESRTKLCRRENIINVAMNMFYEQGLMTTTMKDIANKAGIGRSTIYEYFNSKLELLSEIRCLYLEELYDLHIDIDENMTGFEQLESIMVSYLSNLLKNPKLLVFFIEYNRQIILDKVIDENIKFQIYKTHHYLSEALEKGQKDGSLDIPNLEKRVHLAIEAIFGVASRYAIKQKKQDENEILDLNIEELKEIIPIIIYGLKTEHCNYL